MPSTSAPKNALITGGSRGIGAATARMFASRGINVAVNYRVNQSQAEEVCRDARAFGVKAWAIQADLCDGDGVDELFKSFDAECGQLDILVNNAAILMKQGRLEDFSEERMLKIMRTNVIGPMLCCREAIRRMSTKNGGKGGAIVNLSSLASKLGAPNEYIDYAASKGAIDTMTKGLALEVANEGIRVNVVRPGLILTDIHADGGDPNRVQRLSPNIPLCRGGTAEEVAEAIYWLASDKSSYTTGASIDVSGGR